MQILKGTKREITVMEWQEQLEKHMERANESMECFKRFHSVDDLERLKEDAENIMHYCNHAIESINFMDKNGIK